MTSQSSIAAIADSIDEDFKPTRRRILGLGTAFVAGIATVMARSAPAYADCQQSPCCNLVFCTRCAVTCTGWACPSGHIDSWWTCVSGSRSVLCGECTVSSNCRDGTYQNCSIWYYLNEAPQTIWKGRRWAGGPILAPWASGQVIRCIDDELSHLVTSVCMIGWTSDDPNHMAWIAAREAKDLLSGQKLGKRREGIVSDRVVRIALDHAANFINHNNALVQAEDKAYFVRTLQELVRGGHVYDLDEIATYAMATGWTGLEIKRIKEYGRRVLDEKSFRLEAGIGPRPGDCKRWEAEATGAK